MRKVTIVKLHLIFMTQQDQTSPCWYCTMYPCRTPLVSAGGLQERIRDFSVGLSNSRDAGGPGTAQTQNSSR